MATTSQAKKRVRQTLKRTARNRARKNRVRTFLRHFEDAMAVSDGAKAESAFRSAESEIMRGASKGVVRKKTASRKVSRMHKSLKAIAAKA